MFTTSIVPSDFEKIRKELKKCIATIPDFPQPGIMFKDTQSILKHPRLNTALLEMSLFSIKNQTQPPPDAILGFESRGFLFGFSIAVLLGVPFFMARKPGKLPGELVVVSFEKEYGADTLSIQKGLSKPGMRVLVHDDLLATGGTARAAVDLIQKEGGEVWGFHFIMELAYLSGREKIKDYGPVFSEVVFNTPDE